MGKHRADSARARAAEGTRQRLVDAALERFAADGFAATSLAAIACHAQVTKGALYHHFADKQALYLAAYEAAHARLAANVEALSVSGQARDRFEVFVDGCVAFAASVVTEPWIVAITVTEGPAALGYERWRALDAERATAVFGDRLARMQANGLLRDDVDTSAITALLNALVNEAAIAVASASDPTAAAARMESSLRALMGGLRAN